MNAFGVEAARPGQAEELERLYLEAFPSEDLTQLLRELLAAPAEQVLHLVAAQDAAVVGHVAFSACGVRPAVGAPRRNAAFLLGPLAVAESRRRRGVAAALIGAGLERLAAAGAVQVDVLGDPAFYGRFGFEPDPDLAPPYALPAAYEGAWRRRPIGEGGRLTGVLEPPAPWMRPALWRP